MASLPPDVMNMICEELANRRDFGTLFHLCLSGKQMAGGALWWLYRIHTHTSIRGGESNEDEMSRTGEFKETSIAAREAQQRLTVSQWALQWRSIILSSLGRTVYPYCLYIQSLDLRNLVDLLEDNIFQGNFQDMFFSSLPSFGETQINTRILRSKGKGRTPINIRLFINSVGDSISKSVGDSANLLGTTAALNAIDLSGNIDPVAFPTWLGRLSRLESMALWDGTVLNRQAGEIIHKHCQNFKSLSIYTCHGDKVDFNLASFLDALPKNTLKSLRVFSYNDIAGKTFQALNQHRESLVDLTLGNLKAPAIRSLSVLKGLTALLNLDLDDSEGRINLESTANDSFLELIGWVTGCMQLKTIRLNRFVDGPAIMRALCLDDKIRLNSVTLRGYPFAYNQELHRSLANQTELKSLELRAETDDDDDDIEDIDILVSSLSSLKELRYLNILDTSNNFQGLQVELLAVSLPNLEDLSTSGHTMGDEVWGAISQLYQLRSLSFHSMTAFTFDGIMKYLSNLRQSNYGIHLYIMNATAESRLSPHEQTIIKQTLEKRVNGRFSFVQYREVESDFDSESD
ncbi:hypothetical protein VC83_05326 [Pseudogymnoascus destructans]|uniref:F-box domain-containing protein n=2 Tax=Pseudogymnoascus destructans TaxID=655981 RepID=L8FZW9_PSED2|nr:uncharacterized protein VC83_05326 [Pseudogymnoascus destructans]ELR06417.1 hypothetical protein GMDG_02133 [Pseudogymnoascus destructans 20631-21]OAF58005.1 hypothetical protein VC83_05326 [Pseudogymnoascus destructans]